ncbi:MAG: S8 family serine peptidase, partial [Methanosarcinales archaeon]|nr:S8 family serine peptidase [Methanosarcinales archaeon]
MKTKANKLVMIGLLAAMLILTSGCIDSGIDSPGDAVKPITVGASDQYGRVAEFSSSGPTSDGRTKPTLVAPGVDIISCRAWDTTRGEPVDDYYITASGTSMSTPYTAGAAALLLQANPDLTPAGVKAALTTTAVKLDNTKGHEYEEFYQGTGKIDAYQAYLAINNDPLALSGIVPDQWIAGVWTYTGLAYGADRPTKKVYAVSPGCEDFANFVFATDRELSGVAITTNGTAGDWIIVQPLPDSIPANGQETCYATLTVPDGTTSGMYTGNITISGDEGAVLSVPVTVNIAQSVEIVGGMGAFNGSLDDCEWEYFYFDVPASTERLEVVLKDYTDNPDLILFTPRHECIVSQSKLQTDANTDTGVVENPSAGRWMAIVYGDDISENTMFNGTITIYKMTCTPPRWNPGVLKPGDMMSQSFSVANDGIRLSNASLDAIMLNITEAHRFKGSIMEQGNVSEYFTVPSGLDQFELTVKCDDVDGMLYLELRDPSGRYAGYAQLESGVTRLRLTKPAPGRWKITTYCGYLPWHTESVSFRGAVDFYRHESCDWISFDNDTRGTLPSGSGANFTATVRVPDSVEPGDYVAAIEISSDQETFDLPVSFVVQTPLFSGIGPDHGNDTDGDGLHDYLTVNVSMNSGISGEYQLRGRLEDRTGNYIWAETIMEATGADQTVQINFEGTSIWKNRINDTYNIYLYMYSRRGDLLDRSNYTTVHYNYTEFQPLPAIFTDVYSDNGADTDGDGLYDYLVIDVGVDVIDAGNYNVRATLYEHGGMSVDGDSNYTYLNSGNQTVQLKFYGLALRQNGYDGRYDLRDLGLYNTTYSDPYPVPPIPVSTPIAIPAPEEPEPVEPKNITALYEEVDRRKIAYTTAYYNHTDFQR